MEEFGTLSLAKFVREPDFRNWSRTATNAPRIVVTNQIAQNGQIRKYRWDIFGTHSPIVPVKSSIMKLKVNTNID